MQPVETTECQTLKQKIASGYTKYPQKPSQSNFWKPKNNPPKSPKIPKNLSPTLKQKIAIDYTQNSPKIHPPKTPKWQPLK